jgi:hypothetical protein
MVLSRKPAVSDVRSRCPLVRDEGQPRPGCAYAVRPFFEGSAAALGAHAGSQRRARVRAQLRVHVVVAHLDVTDARMAAER